MEKDSHILKESLFKQLPKDKKIVFASFDEIDVPYPLIKPDIQLKKIVLRHKNDKGLNPHSCNPNYLKKTEAEENLEKGTIHDPLSE